MNCQECQDQLLSCADPVAPPVEVEAHLAECHACRQQQLMLLQIEANVARVPVPPSEVKEHFLRQLLEPAQPLVEFPRPDHARRPPPTWSRRQWTMLAVGCAAALLLTVCGIWLGNMLSRRLHDGPGPMVVDPGKGKKPPAKPLVAMLLDCDLRLAQAQTAEQQVESLAELAEVLHGETALLAQTGSDTELHALAKLYAKVLDKGLVARAQLVPEGKRKSTLNPIAERLAQASSATAKLAEKAAPKVVEPLQVMVAAARTGNAQLKALMAEAVP